LVHDEAGTSAGDHLHRRGTSSTGPRCSTRQRFVSPGAIRLGMPGWHERGLTRPPSQTLLVHLGTNAGTRSWSTNSLAATCGRHGTCAEACNLPWPQRYSYVRFLPLYGRCANESVDRSKYGDAPERGNGRIGSADTSMPGWLVADEGDRTLFSAIRSPYTLIGEAQRTDVTRLRSLAARRLGSLWSSG